MSYLSWDLLVTKCVVDTNRCVMKRRHCSTDGNSPAPRKKRRLEAITPFSHRLDLNYMSAIYKHVFHRSFCVDMTSGIMTMQQECNYCARNTKETMKDTKDIMERYMSSIGSSSASNYKVNAMIEELSQTSGANSLQIKESNDPKTGKGLVAFEAKGLKHLSCFFIQMCVMKHVMKQVILDLVSGNLYMECKEMNHDKEEDENDVKNLGNKDTTLSLLMSNMKRNILARHRHQELVSVLYN